MINPNPRSTEHKEITGLLEKQLVASLTGNSLAAIQSFCRRLPELPKSSYAKALLGMGYLYEAFDLMFAVIASNIQETHDESDYKSRYQTMQNVLRPFASEFGIEPGRPLLNPHRKLFLDFYRKASGEIWPSHYPANSDNPWLTCGRHWTNVMLSNLRRSDLGTIDKAKYNLGYHWSVEFLSVGEFDNLKIGWHSVGIDAVYLDAHCDVEEEHAGCAAAAIAAFASPDDPLVIRGIRDHENDLAGFYKECTTLIGKESSAQKSLA
jgi:hypothetical protein